MLLSKEDLRRFVKLIDLFRFTLHFRDAHHFREIFACNIASINSRFCLGPDFARAISGHFLRSKFGDLSIFFLFSTEHEIHFSAKQIYTNRRAEQETNQRHEL